MNQSELLKLFKSPNAIYTEKEIRKVFKLEDTSIRRILNNLSRWGFIEKVEREGNLPNLYMRLR